MAKLCGSIYLKYIEGSNPETENRMVVVKQWGLQEEGWGVMVSRGGVSV